MKFKEIEKIAKRISKERGMEHNGDYHVIVDKVKEGRVQKGLFARVRTELASYEGGHEFMREVEEKLGYDAEYRGGCVYEFFDRK